VVSWLVRTMFLPLVQMKEGGSQKRKNQREDDGQSSESTHDAILGDPIGYVNEAEEYDNENFPAASSAKKTKPIPIAALRMQLSFAKDNQQPLTSDGLPVWR
jgi:hypothetical protein